jgi:phosphatidylglycerophosphatase A
MGSLASLLLWVPVLWIGSWPTHLAFLAILFGIGLWASNTALARFDSDDPKAVVIDEVVGMGLSLLWVPFGFLNIALSFGLFRLFDIWKPWPIRQIERRFHRGFGIMIDDVIAGAIALAFSQLILWVFKQ